MMLQTALVPFRGQTLLTVRDGDQVRVAIRPICEALGLNWSGQYLRITRDPVLSKGVCVMQTPSGGGVQETLTLPLDLLNGWLFGIDSRRVRPEVREQLIAYQEECYAVLARHWGITPRRALPPAQYLAAHGRRARIVTLLARARTALERRALHDQLAQLSADLGLPCPALEEFVPPDPDEPVRAEFWATVRTLLDGGAALNHARAPHLLALCLHEVADAARAAGQPLPPIGALRRALHRCAAPRFVGVKAVNSRRLRRTVKCWVFDTRCAPKEPRHA